MSRRVMVAGAGGFLGAHLANTLAATWDVIGAGRSPRPKHLSCRWHRCEDTELGLAEAATTIRPDLLIDAAFVNRKPAHQSDHQYLAALQGSQLALYEACAVHGIPLLLTSSSAVYGEGATMDRLTEETPLQPVSLYGLAKTQQELYADHVHRQGRLRLCIARLFNLLGPGSGRGTVVHDWVSQVATFPASRLEPPILRVRNLQTSRDFVDPRDATRALGRLAERLIEGPDRGREVFNVASGRVVSLREIEALLRTLCPVPYEVEETQPFPELSDPRTQRGDARRLHEVCGWSPEIDWVQSVRDVWDQYFKAAA